MTSRRTAVERLYETFEGYPCPPELWVCAQCGPEWTGAQICATALRAVSLPQLVAVHVMALDDDALRYFLPRLLDVMLDTPGPVFDFRLADLKDRLPAWRPEEVAAVAALATGVWADLCANYPAAPGYFSDAPAGLDLLDWCGLPLTRYLDRMCAEPGVAPARHLADIVDAVLSLSAPFETASKATVLDWVSHSAVGDRLQDGFFAAGDDNEAAQQLSSAHELWTVCGR